MVIVMNRILIVDDNFKIVEFIKIALLRHHYDVYTASDGEEALELLERVRIDLAVVDIMMPVMNGWEFSAHLKAFRDIPVLFLSALGAIDDKTKSYQMGADDYLVKPFMMEELILRIEALLRRFRLSINHENKIGDLFISTDDRSVKVLDKVIHLPLKEFQILALLSQSVGNNVSREHLLTSIWGYDYEGDERTLDVHVSRLRIRLNDCHANVMIKSSRGVGYRLELNNDIKA